jgi:hypothetical protein
MGLGVRSDGTQSRMNRTDATPVLDIIDGFRRSQTLFAAVQLGIFDGARPAGPDIYRLLEACVSLGLLTKSESGFANTEVADTYLRSESPGSLAGYLRFASAGLYLKWANLAEAIGGEAARKSNDTLETKPHAHRDFMDGIRDSACSARRTWPQHSLSANGSGWCKSR